MTLADSIVQFEVSPVKFAHSMMTFAGPIVNFEVLLVKFLESKRSFRTV